MSLTTITSCIKRLELDEIRFENLINRRYPWHWIRPNKI